MFKRSGAYVCLVIAVATGFVSQRNTAHAATAEDQKLIQDLDSKYQSAVEKNDAATMDRLLADDFLLVTGTGKKYAKADLLNAARAEQTRYELQSDTEQSVRVWGNTAVITAKLHAKGTENGKPFDYTLWFSDTYMRTSNGWQYVFGQAAQPLKPANN
jgi:ketosteroid isomerase-like protein